MISTPRVYWLMEVSSSSRRWLKNRPKPSTVTTRPMACPRLKLSLKTNRLLSRKRMGATWITSCVVPGLSMFRPIR
ncbi:hypothetical protein D9M68_739350 [compost metagenome]